MTGIDLLDIGNLQLNNQAKELLLDAKGLVYDLNEYKDLNKYDIILMDSMFHFYKSDIENETKILNKRLKEGKIKGKLIVILQKSNFRIKYLKNLVLVLN